VFTHGPAFKLKYISLRNKFAVIGEVQMAASDNLSEGVISSFSQEIIVSTVKNRINKYFIAYFFDF
jgi:hypothetical protein